MAQENENDRGTATEERRPKSRQAPIRRFRLKVGTHGEGAGVDLKMYHAAGSTPPGRTPRPGQDIIESRTNLARRDPNKYEPYDGPLSPNPFTTSGNEPEEEDLPPGPPSHFDRAAAAAVSARGLTPTEKMRRAEQLRKQADALEEEAEGEVEAAQRAQADRGGDEDEDEDDLDSMTVPELRALAESEEVDVPGDARKADILKAIRESREAKG